MARGPATCWHGYAALLGFGITRTRNHISAARPVRGKMICIHHEDFPDRVILIINGTKNYSLTEYNSSDSNVTDGKVYNKTINLPVGIHNFSFWAADEANVSTNTTTYPGPYIDDGTLPNVTLISPEDYLNLTNQTVNFTVNVSDDAGIKNVTLYVYNQTGLFNSSTITYAVGVTQRLVGITMSLVDGIYKW